MRKSYIEYMSKFAHISVARQAVRIVSVYSGASISFETRLFTFPENVNVPFLLKIGA